MLCQRDFKNLESQIVRKMAEGNFTMFPIIWFYSSSINSVFELLPKNDVSGFVNVFFYNLKCT